MVLTDGDATFAGLERALDGDLVDKVGFTGSSAVGATHRRAVRAPPAVSAAWSWAARTRWWSRPTPTWTWRVEGALFSGFGTAGQRCTSMGTAIVHESVYDDFLAALHARHRAGRGRRPVRRRAVRADDQPALRRPVRGVPRAGRGPPRGVGLDRHRPDHGRQPAPGLRGRPRRRPLLPPHDRRRRDRRGRRSTPPRRSARWWAWPASATSTRRSSWPTATATACRPPSTPATPPTPCASASGQRRDAVGEQLHLGRRGPPALRRQRPLGQRLAPVGDLGAGSVHPLAVDELGLRRQAAEGPDGHRRRRGRPGLPAAS